MENNLGVSYNEFEDVPDELEDGKVGKIPIKIIPEIQQSVIKDTFGTSFKEAVIRSIPNIFILLINNGIPFFNVFFVGMSGNFVALVSWGLAAMTANILIDTLDCGLMGGVDTLVSQSFGRKDFYSWSLYLNICRYLLLLLAIPQLIVFYFAEQILVQLDQPEEIAFQTCQFLLIVFPGYIALVQFKTVRHYLNWWNIFNPILVIAGITLIIQVLGLYILVITLEYGIVGVGISTSISYISEYIMTELYTYFQEDVAFQAKWMLPNMDMIKSVPHYLSFGIPSCLALIFNFAPHEIIIIFSGWLGKSQLGANVILSNIYFIVWEIPYGIWISTIPTIGIPLGSKDPHRAKLNAISAILLTVLLGLALLGFIWFKQDSLLAAYTDEIEVIKVVKEVFISYIFYIMWDYVYFTTEGILTGMGYQWFLAIFAFILYWMIMIPGAYVLSFSVGFGYIGIWLSSLLAKFVLALLNVFVIWKANWEELAEIASKSPFQILH